jgi:hypothetical protein
MQPPLMHGFALTLPYLHAGLCLVRDLNSMYELRHTVVTEIGFRILFISYVARTAAGKALYLINHSALQGWYMRLRKW